MKFLNRLIKPTISTFSLILLLLSFTLINAQSKYAFRSSSEFSASVINGMNLGAIRLRRTDPLKADCSAASSGEPARPAGGLQPTFSSAEAGREGGLKDTIALSDTNAFEMKKSPWGAVIRSAILPGLGQFYNESYWKIPFVIGGISFLLYEWKINDNLFNDYTKLYLKDNDYSTSNFYYRQKEKYRDQRDLYAVFIGISYFLNLVDAFVDAHLFDFDVSNEPLTQSIRLNMQLKLSW